MNEHENQFASIDRLATGELDGDPRRELFAWLDGEPSRWRHCALALLEARELEQAFGDWRAEAPPSIIQVPAPAMRRFRLTGAFALAASFMIAFTLGLIAHGFWSASGPMIAESPRPSARDASSQPTKTSSSHVVAEQPQAAPNKNVATVAAAPAAELPPDLFPPYVRSQLERRGYQVKSRHALLPVVLPDGRRLTLPFDELQLNYVGHRAY